jgi:hypothetical protein
MATFVISAQMGIVGDYTGLLLWIVPKHLSLASPFSRKRLKNLNEASEDGSLCQMACAANKEFTQPGSQGHGQCAQFLNCGCAVTDVLQIPQSRVRHQVILNTI